ncbi:MAG: magnesium chelatase subunit [Solirubrobacteraceae bacterium]|nr:magnesium chelatase subunit [Solirubrobacteraceae bacterium]
MIPAFPLSAIVGQQALVEALLINAVAPDVGGVLIRGERGTAKSTAVRGLAPLLPPVRAAAGEPFAFAPGELGPSGPVPADAPVERRPAPLVELPLGASLDRLVGALDLGRALAGERAFEPGLLARAHQGILYVDEVNLLPDHLVDALLDAAASAVARVERDAVSVQHAARFLLVGTMNVEEGDLRPQLLDRFGLGVEVRTPTEPAERAEIVRRRLAFERDPDGFGARFAGGERALAERIATARERLDAVRLPERELLRITGACARLGVDGVRGDIVCARAARALAALDGAEEVRADHVHRAAALALAHRRRRDPLDGQGDGADELERALAGAGDPQPPDDPPNGGGGGDGAPPPPTGSGNGRATAGDGAPDPAPSASAEPPPPDPSAPARERRDPPAPAGLPLDALRLAGAGRGPRGRRARAGGADAGAIDSRPAAPGSDDLAVVATLRARLTGAGDRPLREHVRGGREGVLLCLVVDASGSMGARRRLARVKGALLGLLRDAYARRDRVAIVAFRDGGAHLLVTPGAPLHAAAEAVRALPTGGRTPLAAGLDAAVALVQREALREPGRRAIAVVLTDGRVADPAGDARRAAARLGRAAAAVHVVDTEDGPVRLGLAAALAAAAGGHVHPLTPATTRRAA